MRRSSRGNPYHDERGRFCSRYKAVGAYVNGKDMTLEEYDSLEEGNEYYEQRTRERLGDQRFLFKPTLPENTDNPFGFVPTEYDGVTYYLISTVVDTRCETVNFGRHERSIVVL